MMNLMKAEGEAKKEAKPKEVLDWHKAAFEDIDKLGPMKKNEKGVLHFDYFKDLMLILSRHARASFATYKQAAIEKRRKLLKEFKLNEYSELVKDLVETEEKAINSVTDAALAHIGLSEEEYMMNQEIIMMNDPGYKQFFMQTQQAPEYDHNKNPTITREKAKEIFIVQEKMRFTTMKSIMEKAMKNPAFTQQAQMEQMIEGMVANARIVDTIFEKHGVDEDEQTHAVLKYGLMEDPEC